MDKLDKALKELRDIPALNASIEQKLNKMISIKADIIWSYELTQIKKIVDKYELLCFIYSKDNQARMIIH